MDRINSWRLQLRQANDFIEEATVLAEFLESQPDSVFETVTLFKSWTVNDVLGHLHMFDVAALKTVEGEAVFDSFMKPVLERLNQGMSLLEAQYPFLGNLKGRELFEKWQETTKVLGQKYATIDPKQRVKWVGPDMSALSSITARQMETWAHGQEVFDALGVQRKDGDRIKNICHLGVVTFSWTFKNRQMPTPDPVPFVNLTSPSEENWEWNDNQSKSSIRGNAVEFAQVVTQVRNIKDTSLEVIGHSADQWMSLAQCFAGAPITPPVKGSRYKV